MPVELGQKDRLMHVLALLEDAQRNAEYTNAPQNLLDYIARRKIILRRNVHMITIRENGWR
jgi:hypothetical protein